MEIEVFLDKDKFKNYQRDRTRNQKLVICLDKSGSMSGSPIEIVKKQCMEVGATYFDMKSDKNPNLVLLPFDSSMQVLSAKNFLEFENQIKSVKAGGGTDFSRPIDYIA